MNNIVIEGPDAAGKSTLANQLLQHFPLTLQKSEGPPKYPGEMEERVGRYLRMDNVLFDRHPCISQVIYDKFREKKTPIPQELVNQFYAQGNLIIYMYGRAGAHEIKAHDSQEHLELLDRFEDNIRNAYTEWAPGRAHVYYSATFDRLGAVLGACGEYLK